MTTSASPEHRVSRLGTFSWALFDWANQPFFTLVTTFIFAPYFAATVIGDPVQGQSLWGYYQAAAGLAIALLGPIFGAIADAHGRRKPWLALFATLAGVGSFALWWAVPNMYLTNPSGVFGIIAALILATCGIEFAIVFNNAMLPSLVPTERMGRLSGFAWGLGYVGGLIALFIVLFGFALPETPWLGLSKAAGEPDRLTGPLTAVWLAVFILPLFLFTPDAKPGVLTRSQAVKHGLRALVDTLRHVRRYSNVVRYLIARMIYNDGIAAVIGFAGIYAKGMFGWSTVNLGIFGIILTVFGAIGAFIGGRLDDCIGSKRTVQIALVMLLIGTIGATSISTDYVLFFIPVPAATPGFLNSSAQYVFMAFGLVIGLAFGPAQAASRTLMARLAPAGMVTEFFGLYALSGKATAFLAPLAIAVTTSAFGSQRAGMAIIALFFLVGLFLLIPVNEEA